MGLLIAVLILALVGGFLGGLLEFAAWLIAALALLGAVIGFVAYRAFDRVKNTVTYSADPD